MSIRLSAPGLVCCAGRGGEAAWLALTQGDCSGIRPVALHDNTRFLAGLAADMTGRGDGDRFLPDAPLPAAEEAAAGTAPAGWPAYARAHLFGMAAAALEQIQDETAAAIAEFGAERVGVCVGSCDNGSEASTPAHRRYFEQGAFPPDYRVEWQGPAQAAEWVAQVAGARGPCTAAATACASSASALVQGARLIKAGVCDAVIAGGVDLVSEMALRGFDALELVSSRASNPFSRNRSGVVLGEGAAFFVLSRSTGAAGGIDLLGWGESADAYHITAPRPDGSGAAAAMRKALAMAGVAPGAVDYVNLHGTGTVLNDSMEAAAMYAVFGGSMPLASSTKPVTGHTLGAAGALELAFCWIALDRARRLGACPLPVHLWDGEADGGIPAMNLAAPGQTANPRIGMSNSFAFGGCNVSLVIGRVS